MPDSDKLDFTEQNIRLSEVRSCVSDGETFDDNDVQFIKDQYKLWMDEDVFIACQDQATGEKVFFRGPKRGNSVYAGQITKRINEQTAFLEEDWFRQNYPVRVEDHQHKTNVLHVTLTWNPKVSLGSQRRAWNSISYYYNKFITSFREKFGESFVLRTYESFENGFPHVHMLIITNRSFDSFKHNGTWRVEEKEEIADLWHSNVDVKSVDSAKKVRDYILKDMTKSFRRKQDNKDKQDWLTLSMNWFFGKQSFAVSNPDNFFSTDLITESITQSRFADFFARIEKMNLKYEGLIHIFFSDSSPPNYIRKKLTEKEEIAYLGHLKEFGKHEKKERQKEKCEV